MNYKITLDTSGVTHKATGETILEAINNTGLTWEKIKAKGVIKIINGKRKLEHLFTMQVLKRIFANKGFRLVWAKRLEKLLK